MSETYLNFSTIKREGWSYQISILQYAADAITLILKNEAGRDRFYCIPVKRSTGIAWKVNKKSISNDTGNALDAIHFLVNPQNKAYLFATIRELIFSGNIKEF